MKEGFYLGIKFLIKIMKTKKLILLLALFLLCLGLSAQNIGDYTNARPEATIANAPDSSLLLLINRNTLENTSYKIRLDSLAKRIGSTLTLSFELVDDTSPQLGGNLDSNGFDALLLDGFDIGAGGFTYMEGLSTNVVFRVNAWMFEGVKTQYGDGNNINTGDMQIWHSEGPGESIFDLPSEGNSSGFYFKNHGSDIMVLEDDGTFSVNNITALTTNGDLTLSGNGTGTVQTSSGHTASISAVDDVITKGYADANYLEIDPPRGGIYITTPVETVITTISTPVKALGTTSTVLLNSFDDNGGISNRIRYTGATTKVFQIVCATSFTTATNSQVIEMYLAKNGVIDVSTTTLRKTGTGTDVGAAALSGLVSLATNDYIELWVANTTGTANVTFETMNLSAK
jgi:hypothetical protein